MRVLVAGDRDSIGEMVYEAVPGSGLSFVDGASPDLRNYRVDFSKLAETFPPGSEPGWSVREGIEELVGAYAEHGLSHDDFTSSSFVRIRRIREFPSVGLLNDTLHRQTSVSFPAADADTGRESR